MPQFEEQKRSDSGEYIVALPAASIDIDRSQVCSASQGVQDMNKVAAMCSDATRRADSAFLQDQEDSLWKSNASESKSMKERRMKSVPSIFADRNKFDLTPERHELLRLASVYSTSARRLLLPPTSVDR